MSISGVLEDLPLADVLQFIHLGRRTGTLYLWQADRRAEIGFFQGRILNAKAPGQKRLGDLLVDAGSVDRETVDRMLLRQQEGDERRSLGQLLVDSGAVERAEVHRVIEARIQEAIFELVTWRQGEFHFDVDEPGPTDDFSVEPVELLRDLDLNTQMLLLEATRIFDEKQNRGEVAPEAITALDRHLRRAGFAGTGGARDADEAPESGEILRCQVVTPDRLLVDALRSGLPERRVRVAQVRAREAANRAPGEIVPPMVVVDARAPEALEDVATLERSRPGSPVLVLAPDPETSREALRRGAVGAFVDLEDLLAAARNLVRVQSQPRPRGLEARSLGRFRQVVFDVQAGMSSATMALNLMHVISESVERAVLFLVRGEALTAVGAFGFSDDGEALAVRTRGLRLVPPLGALFRDAIGEGEPRAADWEDAELPGSLAELLGRPASGQVVVFPVQGTERTISLIYTDNGEREEKIEDLRILQLATSQVGAAFENELLGQRLAFGDWDEDPGGF